MGSSRRRSSKWAYLAFLLLAGCSDEIDETHAPPIPAECPPGTAPNEAAGEGCCPAGSLAHDGGCQPAGIPAEQCGTGFEPVGEGCEPILPAEPCSFGLMAVPGETSCREVAPCGSGAWGSIPIDSSTEYVDALYTGGASDGSQAAPWTSIGEAIAAAAPGAIVAIASGIYVEDVFISSKPVKLWGRCPSMVTIVGAGIQPATVFVRSGVNGTEIHDLAVTNASTAGVSVKGAQDVLLDRLWVHDTFRPVNAELAEPTSVTLARSLVEQGTAVGVYVAGVEALVDACVVRDMDTADDGSPGRGITIKAPPTGERANATVRGSVIERNEEVGVFVTRSDALVESSVIRDTSVNALGQVGRGIVIQEHESGARASGTVRSCVVERNHDVGIYVAASDALVEGTVVRDTALVQGMWGRGIAIQDSLATGQRALVTLRSNVVERNHEIGVFVGGSEGHVETTVVRGTQPNDGGVLGRGISFQKDLVTGAIANGTLRGCLAEDNHETAVVVLGSEATVESTWVRNTLPNGHGVGGNGMSLTAERTTGARTTAAVRFSLVEASVEFGISVMTSDATLEGVSIRDTLANAGIFGDGVIVVALDGETSARIESSEVKNSARAGILNAGGAVTLRDLALQCQSIDMDGEALNGYAFGFENLGEVKCGCPDASAECHVVSAGLQPPEPPGSAP